MEFDLTKKIKELEKTYTKESVGKFLDEYINNVRYQGENSFNAFLKNTKVLVKKAGYVSENGTPYYPIGHDTFENLEKDGINLSDEEKLEFEILMAYLIVEKGIEPQAVRELNHKKAKVKNIPFMEAWRKTKALQKPEVKARLNEIYKYYKLEEETLWAKQNYIMSERKKAIR